MGYAVFLLFLLSLGGIARADHTVFLTWEGYVNAPATLRIHDGQVQADSSLFSAVSGDSFRFIQPMPRAGRDIRVNVREGRGTVQIIEQPTLRNTETMTVRIDPQGHGGERYRLEFTSENLETDLSDRRRRDRIGERSRVRDFNSGQVTWSGRVDYEAVVTLRDRQALATAVRGRAVTGERVSFSGRMPNQSSRVDLIDQRGRGEIVVLEQPSADNNYAAKVRIFDQPNGDDLYQFTLQWDNSDLEALPGASGSQPGVNRIVWRAQVDGRVRVSIQGNRSWIDRLSGGPVANTQADFGNPLPRASNVNVRKLSGREDVEVVEEPSAANGYKLVIEIDDDDAGADEYAIEVTW